MTPSTDPRLKSRRHRLAGLLSAAALWLIGPPAAAREPAAVPVFGYQVVHSYPHDPNAFTQGLFFRNGLLYESTGLNGRSSVRKVKLETGEVLQQVQLPTELFGEGIVDWGDRIVGITWQTGVGYVLKLDDFSLDRQFRYPGEGWGITRNNVELIMSDGTPELRFLDPNTLREKRRLRVTAAGRPVDQLNELEWVEGRILANLWQTDRIARIVPATGEVEAWIDLTGLLPAKERVLGHTDVLNGIAYDPVGHRLFVTGKHWPRLYEIKLVKKGG